MMTDSYRFPFFRAAGRIKPGEKAAALERLHSDAQAQIAALRAELPTLAQPISQLLDPAIAPAMAMARFEEWWDAIYRGGSILGLLSRGKDSARTEAARRYFSLPSADEAADLPGVEHVAGFPEVLTNLSRLAVVFAEALFVRRPDYCWAIDPARPNIRSAAIDAGRIVIRKQPGSQFAGFSFDPFRALGQSYIERHDKHYRKTACAQGQYSSPFAGWEIVNLADAWRE